MPSTKNESLSAQNTQRNEGQIAADSNNDKIFAEGGRLAVKKSSIGEFEVLKYPSDIGTAKQPHYVMFYINVRQSDVTKDQQAQTLSGEAVSIDNSQANRESTNGTNTAMNVASGLGSVAAGARLGKMTGAIMPTDLFKGTAELAGFAAGVAMAPIAISGLGGFTKDRTQVLLRKAIALYISGVPTSEYKANWTDSDLGLSAVLGGSGGSLGTGDIKNGLVDLISRVQGGAGYAALKGAGELKNDITGDIAGTAQATSAVVPNPFKAQLFKSMGFRQFGFDYVFLPRNNMEYKSVQNIITTFKTYMHPKLGPGKLIMNYPAEFTIVYYYKGATNEELFKISNCALTSLKVTYGGEDFTTFRGTNGAPTEIGLKLQFTELETLSQERIVDYNY